MEIPEPLFERGIQAVEKIATALEGFREDNEIQVQFGPPICPHCGVFNPRVRTHESADEGPLADYIIDCDCCECGKRMFGVVESYSMHATRDTAIEELQTEGRAGRHE
jgi:hypothetical protein